jgi:hypothetical protein
MDEGNEILVYISSWDFKRSLTCRKILQHGTFGFTSHPKEGVLRIFIAFKTPSPCPGSNPLPLGPVASTLTATQGYDYLKATEGNCRGTALVLWSIMLVSAKDKSRTD